MPPSRVLRPTAVPTGRRDASEAVFAVAVAELEAGIAAQCDGRPEVSIDSEPPPRRLAPHAVAFAATVQAAGAEIGWGRFVLLYDPAGQQGWEGPFRVIAYLRAELEPEIATDPLIGQVGWSWLTEALDRRSAEYAAPSGTVTRVVSEGFGTKQDEPVATGFEMRASWSPVPPAEPDDDERPPAGQLAGDSSVAADRPGPTAGPPGGESPAADRPAPTAGPPGRESPAADRPAPTAEPPGGGQPVTERFCLDRHVAAWADALSAAAGLPPVAPGVAPLRPSRPSRSARPTGQVRPRRRP